MLFCVLHEELWWFMEDLKKVQFGNFRSILHIKCKSLLIITFPLANIN